MKKLFAFAASALLVFASCTNNEFVYENETPQEIGFFPVAKNMTRAAIDGETFNHTNMSVAAYLATGDGVTEKDYFGKTTFTDAGIYFTGGKYWPIQASTLNFLAVAPVETGVATEFGSGSPKANFAGSATVTVTDNQTNQYDVMYAAGQGVKSSNTAPEVGMVFKHALAWVNFTFTASSDKIQINSVQVKGAKFNGVLNITNANYNNTNTQTPTHTWTANDVVASVDVPGQTATALTKNAAAITWGNGLLVVPCEPTSFVINYTVSAGGDEHTYNYTYSTSLNWTAGKQYIYNISMGLQEININPTVTDWSDWTDADSDGVKDQGEEHGGSITIQ